MCGVVVFDLMARATQSVRRSSTVLHRFGDGPPYWGLKPVFRELPSRGAEVPLFHGLRVLLLGFPQNLWVFLRLSM